VPGDPLLLPLSDVRWPLGDHLISTSPAAAAAALAPDRWTDLKLRSARWYVETLRTLAAEAGSDRYAGVEMALDGALANLSGAVDAALARLVRAMELQLGAPPAPDRQLGPGTLRGLLRQGGQAPSAAALEAALDGAASGTPRGWLAQVRRLRNRSTHQTTLPRHHDRAGGTGPIAVTGLAVEGVPGAVDAARWLEARLADGVRLCGDLLADAVATGHHIAE